MSASSGAHSTAGRAVLRRRRLLAGGVLVAVAGATAFVVLRSGAGGGGIAPPSPASPPATVRLTGDGGTLASRPVSDLRGRAARDRWLARVPARRTEVRGRTRITVEVDRSALARRLDRAIAAGGGAVAVPQRPVASTTNLPVLRQVLHNDCEVTALSMLLLDRGKRVDQLTLQRQVAHSAPLVPETSTSGEEIWGDPSKGFVGSAAGNGYGVYQRPIADLARRHGVAVRDLTGSAPGRVFRALLAGHPVMAWVALAAGPYQTWRTPGGKTVHANFGEHAVLLTGIDGDSLSVNDPLSGQRLTWTKAQFEQMWTALGSRALAA